MLRCVKVLFSFAKAQNYLPDEKETAVEKVQLVRVNTDDVTIFSPAGMAKLLHHDPPELVPILAIGAFAGIRMAELEAKTASRRVIPITDNLAAWLTPLSRKGKIVRTKELQTHMPALARALRIEWPRNVLRHSFISYRIAQVKSANQVALEAGNSWSIIFKHYRELTTEDEAEKWFVNFSKEGRGATASLTTAGPAASPSTGWRLNEPPGQSARQRTEVKVDTARLPLFARL